MGEASRQPTHYPSANLVLPSFHDFDAFTRHPANHYDPAAPGSSRQAQEAFESSRRFMSSVNHTAHVGTNGIGGGDRGTRYEDQAPAPAMTGDPAFDILDWYPAYQSCQRYFLDHAQHEPGTQALCALINIRLPFQYLTNPITSSSPPHPVNSPEASRSPSGQQQSASTYQFNFSVPSPSASRNNPQQASNPPTTPFISLLPYLRRLTVTGFDKPPILHGLFGDDYVRGILPHLDCERRNYLFLAKHGGWRSCKRQYDVGSGMGGDEGVPFMKPLEEVGLGELQGAEKAWGRWLAMEDWMVGPDAVGDGEGEELPNGIGNSSGVGR